MRLILLCLMLAGVAGCELIYKLPTRQGNVIEQKQLDKLQAGMSREQVRFLLGTPIADSPFREDRWDYTGYYKSPRGKVFSRTVTLYFEDNRLARMEGIERPGGNGTGEPELEDIEAGEQKTRTEKDRAEDEAETGIVITPGG